MSYTDFKETTSDNVGTATRYGGNDVKEVMRIFNGKSVPSRRPKILNEWIWLDHFDVKPPISVPANPSDANASRIYADPSDFKLKLKKTSGVIVDLENTNIPDSALATITDKAKLNTNIVYKDQNNDLGDFYLDIGDISTPSNPSAGKRRMFVDTATGQLSVRTPAGTTITLEGGTGGGTGGGDVFLNDINVYGDFDNMFRSGRLKVRNPANTFSYSFTGAAVIGDRVLNLPLLTGADTLVTQAFGQTLTNKTLIQNNNTLQMWNTAADRKYIFKVPDGVPSGADITIEWPNTIVNDQIISAAGTTTFTNKTINLDANTVKHSSSNVLGDLIANNGTKFDRLAKGSANTYLRVNYGGTNIEWGALPGAGNLDALTDVAISTPSSGQHLVYNGSLWTNTTPSAGGGLREDLAATLGPAGEDDVGSSYTDAMNSYVTFAGSALDNGTKATAPIDFTDKTQFKVSMSVVTSDTGINVRIIDDASTSNVLREFTGIGNSTQTSALATLPGWAVGLKTLRLQVGGGSGSSDIGINNASVYLK
jgi:hypothetical protein